MVTPINLFEYESIAPQHLSKMALDYYSSGAWDEITLRDNRTAYEHFKLRPRMLVDVSNRDLSTQILGQFLSMPILIAPMAFQCLAYPEGELATAKAAAQLGTAMVLSTMSTKSLEEVAKASKKCEQRRFSNQGNSGEKSLVPHPLWFQLYVHRDRCVTRTLVQRAEAAGFTALCLTVDAPVLGRRERDSRNQFTLPPEMELANLATMADLEIPKTAGESGLFTYFAQQLDQGLTWQDLEWLQSLTRLPIVVKGILRGDDALRAFEYGAKAGLCLIMGVDN